MVDEHYVLDLPFKDDSVTMPNNRSQAEQRVAMLGKKFTKNGEFHDEYTSFNGQCDFKRICKGGT
jgi:hypothetical protein